MSSLTYKGLAARVLENDTLRLTFLPQYACKLTSLISKKTKREFLFQAASKQLRVPPYPGAVPSPRTAKASNPWCKACGCPIPFPARSRFTKMKSVLTTT